MARASVQDMLHCPMQLAKHRALRPPQTRTQRRARAHAQRWSLYARQTLLHVWLLLLLLLLVLLLGLAPCSPRHCLRLRRRVEVQRAHSGSPRLGAALPCPHSTSAAAAAAVAALRAPRSFRGRRHGEDEGGVRGCHISVVERGCCLGRLAVVACGGVAGWCRRSGAPLQAKIFL